VLPPTLRFGGQVGGPRLCRGEQAVGWQKTHIQSSISAGGAFGAENRPRHRTAGREKRAIDPATKQRDAKSAQSAISAGGGCAFGAENRPRHKTAGREKRAIVNYIA